MHRPVSVSQLQVENALSHQQPRTQTHTHTQYCCCTGDEMAAEVTGR